MEIKAVIRRSVSCAAALFAAAAGLAAGDAGFRVETPGVKVSDLQVDSAVVRGADGSVASFRLGSPLECYAARSWIRLSGREGLWGCISSGKFRFDPGVPDLEVGDDVRRMVLGEEIEAVVTYRDSVAAVVIREDPDYLLLNYCWLEDGRWVNGGQAIADDMAEARGMLSAELPRRLADIPRIAAVESVPTDIAPFARFAAGVRETPEEFLLRQLKSHRLVINGELHRRKVSWDMLRRLAAMPEFPAVTGTVFMELPSHRQPTMDRFFAADTMDVESLYSVFRDEQPNGWWDRGEFEFLCDLWRLNRSLPEDSRIGVVLADYQVPYSEITERTPEAENRDTHMADVVAGHIARSGDSRGNLFLVGCGHACKSDVPGLYSAAAGEALRNTAARQLADRLGDGEVFTVWQHALSGDNNGGSRAAVRGGIFDRAFELAGNRPIGFGLAESPFGLEPFDGIAEIKYDIRTGSYADNFDGFLFLHPLADEPRAEPLDEVFSEAFVAEMKRRAEVLGLSRATWMWFGTTADAMTRASILEALRE
ncbi:MAG: hypothetical protein K2G30_02545 [Muribaculaceae bacterium]|nr:hypothetical protein [Muribaculaceae bacterium]